MSVLAVLVEVVGLLLLVVAAYLVALPLALAVFGGGLLLVGYALGKAGEGKP